MKKSLILFIAESRTTYDRSFNLDTENEDNVNLTNKIFETKRVLGADTAILSSVTLTSNREFYDDWNWHDVVASWSNQCFVEGYNNGKGEFIHEENTSMGKCFYPEGYAELSKEAGFGAWKMVKHQDSRSVTEKLTEYIQELSETYDITQIFFFYDYGYSEQIIDIKKITKELQIPINYFIPTKPYCSQSTGININEFGCTATSSLYTMKGINECFEQYLQNIEKIKPATKTIKK